MTAELIRPLRNLKVCAGTQEGVPSRFASREHVFVGPGPTHNCLDPLLKKSKGKRMQQEPRDSRGYTHTHASPKGGVLFS